MVLPAARPDSKATNATPAAPLHPCLLSCRGPRPTPAKARCVSRPDRRHCDRRSRGDSEIQQPPARTSGAYSTPQNISAQPKTPGSCPAPCPQTVQERRHSRKRQRRQRGAIVF
jgi:hypothetical protein